MKGQGKPQPLLQDDSSPLQRSKYLLFLPIGLLWHLSRNVIVASARVISYQETNSLGAEGVLSTPSCPHTPTVHCRHLQGLGGF